MANRNRGGTATYPQQASYAGSNFPQGQPWQGSQQSWSPQGQGQYMLPAQINQTKRGVTAYVELPAGVTHLQLRGGAMGTSLPAIDLRNLSQGNIPWQQGSQQQGFQQQQQQQGFPIAPGAGQSGAYNLAPILQGLNNLQRTVKQMASGQSFQQGRQKRNR